MRQYIALCSAGPMNDYRFSAENDEEALRSFRVDFENLPQHWTFQIYELKALGEVHAPDVD